MVYYINQENKLIWGGSVKNFNIKAALFDLDGVIVFTDKYHYLAWKKLSDEQGWDFDEQLNNRLRGIPRLASLEVILEHNKIELPMEEKLRLMEIKNNYYVELLEKINDGDIYTGVVDFIKKLRAHGTKTAICSSSKNAKPVLDKLGLTELFDAIVTGHDIKNAKPDPEIFLTGAKRLNMPVFHCVVFEDAKAGIEGAKAAKMRTVGVGNREETEELADQFIINYEEIDVYTFLESGAKQPLPVCEDKIIEEGFNPREIGHMESLFSLGNGYIGLRGTYDEYDENIGAVDAMYINGIYSGYDYVYDFKLPGYSDGEEYTINLTDWRIFNLYIDGEKATFSNKNIKDHTRKLDMRKGAVTRSFVFETASGKQALVNSVRIVNMNDVHSAQVSYSVKPINFSGEVVIESAARKITTLQGKTHAVVANENVTDDIFSYVQHVDYSNQDAATAIAHTVVANDYTKKIANEGNLYTYTVTANAKEGETVTVNKFAAFSTTMDNVADMENTAIEIVTQNRKLGFEKLASLQEEFWKKHWEIGDIVIEGNPADQQAVRYSLFQLKQQLATVNKCSIGATGLTGPGYSGKVFWDTEMYLMPYYNFTRPETQRELFMYRYRLLDKARKRAADFGLPGAMYAWASITGSETSTIYEASVAEYHLQSDIPYAIWRYYDSTGDKDFLYNYGAEIVFETAKFMSHRGDFIDGNEGKFCINVVCGPDEYACGVNNNMYTNFMVKFHFYFALDIIKEMKENAPEKLAALMEKCGLDNNEFDRWQRAADNMYYRYNEQYGIHEQDDSFVRNNDVDMTTIPKNVDIREKYHPLDLWRVKVSKQADIVLLNFIQGDKFTYDEKMRDYDYYEPRCNHGSSLSPAIHAIMAIELGKKEAYEFFRCSAYMDLSDFKKNTKNGVHIACLGGNWMTVVNGYLGMRHYKDGILFNPKIPNEWTSYNCKFVYRGATIDIKVTKETAEFKLISGEEMNFKVGETKVSLNRENSVFTVKM